MPRLRAASRARREERSFAGMDAAPPARHRPAPDQRARRHHQLHDLRPRPSAPRLRCEEGEGQPHRAPGEGGRGGAGARRPHLQARSEHRGDRGRERRRIHRRHHGRRAFGLRRDHDRRADRIGALGSAEHRADRPQARHHHRCALPFRARRRSGLHVAGSRPGHPAGDRPVRRRSERSHARGTDPAGNDSSSTSPGARFRACRVSTCRLRNPKGS